MKGRKQRLHSRKTEYRVHTEYRGKASAVAEGFTFQVS